MTTDKIKVGDRVRVKSREAIRATLDGDGCLDHLYFNPSMVEHSGKCYKVDGITYETGRVHIVDAPDWLWHPSWLEKIADAKDTNAESAPVPPDDKAAPPIGLMSRRLWKEQRIDDIMRAIVSYRSSGLAVKVAWYTELRDLLNEVEK